MDSIDSDLQVVIDQQWLIAMTEPDSTCSPIQSDPPTEDLMDQRSRSRTIAALAAAAALSLTAYAPGAQALELLDVVGQVEERAAHPAPLAESRVSTESSATLVSGVPTEPRHDAAGTGDKR
ncbi:hypothetical protein GA707_11860 [Nostocoides sp. F2B08]|uniref:hypothetical protein n=1 Tax=Nostocoides sp. F2B08 TaxID=2653936 RepID=UPI001263B3A8|nr:hypothetical protein [Tetrasphaera sp. F2B08]KAB7744137.1 hypothetical protein GA707_11860 [Tetrasphaera sp. F2B08]